ncbi:hypothetical protein NP493_217g02044 [Ridgeia piscesae]|uniref:Ubiquitin carboxyl-terminal hydrolase 32 n=1 Tax=Ridgeia piscesae TaxID=27915 RepID=A0AAD9P0G2_RIDPI|nr:hypothetical protein NP493_217g02044 [Ridgeia piscesae]
MTQNVFIKEVLGDGVPPRLAERMFTTFGGSTKGICFKDLLCGLVMLTNYRKDEKIKFLFGLYANENLSSISIEKHEMDAFILATDGQVPQSLSDLFRETDSVSYESFRCWILAHPDATSVSKWLLTEKHSVSLSNDLETPTFHQTLAGVTHLEETDIMELEKRYWVLKAQSTSGRFDLDTFRPIVSPPVPESVCQGLFEAFDENCDNHIDFKEMACGISACCRGPQTERQKFCFKVFDTDHDGRLSQTELERMLEAMLLVRRENTPPRKLASIDNEDAAALAKEILTAYDSDKDGYLTQEEYLVWTVNQTLPEDFLHLLFQVSHVVLGLKPANKDHEAQVICSWLDREERRGLQPGQVWYLASMHWWNHWADYVNYKLHQMFQQQPIEPPSDKKPDCFPILTDPSSLFQHRESGSGVIGTAYTPLPQQYDVSLGNKSATLPQCSSAKNSPHRGIKTGIFDMGHGGVRTPGSSSSPAHSLQSTPSQSPRLHRKYNDLGVIQKPGAIDNTPLITPSTSTKVQTLTNEGGRLKRDRMLARDRDFKLLPEPVWKALSAWYGSSVSLPRTVIVPRPGEPPELELYPISVRLLRHHLPPPPRPAHGAATFTDMMGNIGGMMMHSTGLGGVVIPRRYVAHFASFSRQHMLKQVYDFLATRLRIHKDDMRLWKFKDEQNMSLLEDENQTMEDVGVEENAQILIEVRNKDLTWPEEMCQLAKNRASIIRSKQTVSARGATGLNNLGNTCFMNSALQCVSNTRILTLYFTAGMHLYEINRVNPLGMKGHVAQRYGDLVKDLWSGTMKSIAPLKLRWTIGKYAPRFNGFQQHDSQELLAFLLDGLHEDLNRVHDKPYVELKDSDGRSDHIVAEEAWENHLLRNRSIIVDLFHGQLKSCVRCKQCGHTSVRFDPFTYLSLPLPMESCIHLEVIVVRLDGSTPTKYGLRLNMDEKYKGLKRHLGELCDIPATQLLLAEVFGALIKSFPHNDQKIRTVLSGTMYAYELAPPSVIPPLSIEEERAMTLPQIQRLQHFKNTSPQKHSTPAKKVVVNGDVPHIQSKPSSLPIANGIGCRGNPKQEIGNGSTQLDNMNNSSSSISVSLTSSTNDIAAYTIAVHRKMFHMDVYFLSSQKSRPSLFGTPLVLPTDDHTTNQDLYRAVWMQVSRLVSPLPPAENNTHNHAQDCDDSLGYEYPFTLKMVQKDGFTCAHCPWFRFCRGCRLEFNLEPFSGSAYIAVDWEPTALHLRYQTSQEKQYVEHASVVESRRLQTEPIDLNACLMAFMKEEELGEDELYYCSKCKKHQLAVKKLDIWTLPPVLIIHLKRFQYLNGHWVKSQKIVKFPFSDFTPSDYVVPRDEVSQTSKTSSDVVEPGGDINSNGFNTTSKNFFKDEEHRRPDDQLVNGHEMTSPATTEIIAATSQSASSQPITAQPKRAFDDSEVTKTSTNKSSEGVSRAKRLTSVAISDAKYDLYAMSCHTGILGGGHYVSYAKNPNNKWYCYNDSSCKEMMQEQIDTSSAYILFYEQRDLNSGAFMPDITGHEPDTTEITDEFESEFKKMCMLQ